MTDKTSYLLSSWRKTRILSSFLILLLGIVASANESEAQEALWGQLMPGPHMVGFQTISKYDVSRPFKRKYDYYGNAYKGERARPIQISIWYPGVKSANSRQLLFEDYVFLTVKEETFGDLTEKEKQNAVNAFLNSRYTQGTDQAKLAEVLKLKTASWSNATPAKGLFPLVLIAPSIGISSPYGNSILAEYLASNGYVVASSPGMGEDSRQLTFDPIGVGAQMEDIMFLIRTLREWEDVDPDHLALIGFSFGGLAASVLAMHNTDVDAFVSLDSSLANKYAYSQLFQSPLYEPSSLTVPVLHITAQEPNEGTDYSFFKSLKYSNVTYAKLKGMRAIDFSSFGMITTIVPNFGGETQGNPGLGQEAVCRYTLNFLNATVKKDAAAQTFINASPAANGFASGFVVIETKPGFKAPPTEEQFVQILQEKGVGQASAIYAEVKKNDREYQIFEPETLNGLAGELLKNKKTKEAIEILKLNVDAYSNEWETFDLMGMAYMQDGNTQLAVENFEKSLDLNPENANATEMLTKLKKS